MRVGLDTNCANYLFETMNNYDPTKDNDKKLKTERLALIRIFLYLNNLCELPSMRGELKGIKDKIKRNQWSLHNLVNLGKVGNLDQSVISKLSDCYQKSHNQRKDCLILAEAETAKLDFLLTCDEKFIKHLKGKTKVCLTKPSQYWRKLRLPKNSSPKVLPHVTNPLYSQNWYKI